jgi:hypothetical protein
MLTNIQNNSKALMPLFFVLIVSFKYVELNFSDA